MPSRTVRIRSAADRRADRWALLAGLLLTLGALWLRVGPILRSPHEFLLAPYGDGTKTYYALLWYLRYDHGLRFTGMNYPHGDLFTYTDGFPLLAWAVKAWKSVFGLTTGQAIGTLNLTVLLASVLAVAPLFALLRRCGVARWWAVATSVLIALFSPQWHRVPGSHLTLAMSWVLPALWYAQVRLTEARGWQARLRWLAGYATLAFVAGLIHPYYLLHALLLPACTAGVTVLQAGRRWRGALPGALWLLLAAVLSTLLTSGWLALVDPVHDRPTNPYGFFAYHANPASVFAPAVEPLASAWREVFHLDAPIWEGTAYVGLVVELLLALWVVRVAEFGLRGRPWRVVRPGLPAPLQATFWAAFPILLLAMCFPFAWFERTAGWVDHLGPLKQFRALGRFAWTFYYVLSVWAAVTAWQLYRLLRQRRLAALGRTLLGTVLLIWGWETKLQLEAVTATLRDQSLAWRFTGPADSYVAALARLGAQPTDFQAILPLPHYSQGSEKFSYDAAGPIVAPGHYGTSVTEAYRASFQTGLPLLSSMLGRASIEQTLRLLQLLTSDRVPKELPAHLPSRRPVLLLVSSYDTLRPAEAALVRRARPLGRATDVRFYELPLDSFATTRPTRERAWLAAHRPELTRDGALWRTNSGGPGVVWRTFPQNEPAGPGRWPGFTQPGAVLLPRGRSVIFNEPLPRAATDTTTYELAMWAYAKTTNWLPYAEFRQFAPDGHEVEFKWLAWKESTEICGDWVRYSVRFHLTDPANRVELAVGGDDIAMDDLLIRPLGTEVYWWMPDGTPVKNGYPLRPDPAAARPPRSTVPIAQ